MLFEVKRDLDKIEHLLAITEGFNDNDKKLFRYENNALEGSYEIQKGIYIQNSTHEPSFTLPKLRRMDYKDYKGNVKKIFHHGLAKNVEQIKDYTKELINSEDIKISIFLTPLSISKNPSLRPYKYGVNISNFELGYTLAQTNFDNTWNDTIYFFRVVTIDK